MTVNELYLFCLNILKQGGNQDYRFDCDCLFEELTEFDKIKRLICGNEPVSPECEEKLVLASRKRASGVPLQYILGKWNFMGFDFLVGEGVLIPRPETEQLVELADKMIKENNFHTVFDLCSGTGAIGLSIAKMNPECEVYLFEKYAEAYSYLQKNAQSFELSNVHLIKADIFEPCFDELSLADLILSNPPYIKSDEISSLQIEVKKEPVTALDGGNDGLDFYRCIHDKWLKALKENGTFIFECGEGQSAEIISVFNDILKKYSVYYDFNNIDRIVEINV